jgi:hypothetical protein
MSVHIDELIEDARLRISSAQKHLAELSEAGITQEYLQTVTNKLDEVRLLDTGQKGAKHVFHAATREQYLAVDAGLALRSKILRIAKLTYLTDAAVRKEFKTRSNPPRTLEGLRAELDYMQKVVTKRKTELKKRGLQDADIEQLAVIEQELSSKDDAQAKAGIAGTNATKQRNKSAEELRGMLAEIRAAAEIAFEDKNPDVLREFASQYSRRGKAKNGKTVLADATKTAEVAASAK